MHRWKDLSLLKLLLTNLLTLSESQMGPLRTVCICVVPYGSYTTVASRLKRVKLRANVRTQQLQTLVGAFGQQCCSRLHRAKSLTMIKIEIHSVYFIQSFQSIDFTAGLTWKYIWIENPDRSQISQECDFLSRHVLAVPSVYLWAHIRYRLFEIRMFSRG